MSLRQLARAVPGQVRVSAEALRAVFAVPRVRLVAAASVVARLPKGMVPLATVLLLHQVTGSYAIAGITTALVAAGDAASTPVQGRLVDRLGRGWVLIPTAALHVAAVAAVAAVLILAGNGAPVAGVVVCACVAGIGLPPVSGLLTGSAGPAVCLAMLPIAVGLTALIAHSRLPEQPAGGSGDRGGTRLLC